jgi:hypothetical protein
MVEVAGGPRRPVFWKKSVVSVDGIGGSPVLIAFKSLGSTCLPKVVFVLFLDFCIYRTKVLGLYLNHTYIHINLYICTNVNICVYTCVFV